MAIVFAVVRFLLIGSSGDYPGKLAVRRFMLFLFAMLLVAPGVKATMIAVHTSPPFELEATNFYADAYKYSSQADALFAANLFLSDGAAANGWGVGSFGGSSSFQAQYFFFAFESNSNPSETLGVRLGSFGNHFTGSRTGTLLSESYSWSYDNHVNHQYLLLKNEYASVAIPEPATTLLFGIGLAVLSMRKRRIAAHST